MKSTAAVLTAPQRFELRQFDVPEPGENGLVLRVEACGVCGTDGHIFKGHTPGGRNIYPLIPGHEVVGTISALGSQEMRDVEGRTLREGDRVVISPGVACGNCYFCNILKSPTKCVNKKGYGFLPLDPDKPELTGGYSEYMHLMIPRSPVFRTDLDVQRVVLLEPLSIGIHAVERARIEPGSVVAVQGSGAIGIMTAFAAKRNGAGKVILIGGPAKRLELGRTFGADVTIDIAEVTDADERVQLVREATPGGYGADVVFECSGVPPAIGEGLAMLRPSGTYVEVGHFTDVGDIKLNPHRHLVLLNSTIIGVWASEDRHFLAGLRYLEQPGLPFEKLVHMTDLDNAEASVRAVADGAYELDGRTIVKVALRPGTSSENGGKTT